MNQLLQRQHIVRMAQSWFHERAEDYRIDTDVDYYDPKEDLISAIRLRVRARGRDLTCYIFTLDLTKSYDELSRELWLTYLEQLYDPRAFRVDAQIEWCDLCQSRHTKAFGEEFHNRILA